MGKSDKSDKKDQEKKPTAEVLLSPIAKPLANDKLAKKTLKTLKKAAAVKGAVRRGVKEVVKAIKKDTAGLCVIAGNISPIDVIAHVPILCEEKSVPYIYVPSKEELGTASLTKRPTSIVLITCEKGADHEESYGELKKELKAVTVEW